MSPSERAAPSSRRTWRLPTVAAAHRLSEPYPRLFWRVFAVNAGVLALACAVAVAVFSHGSFSSPVALTELGIFAGAVAIMVGANLFVTRRLVMPLEQLVGAMRRVDPLAPGERVEVRGGPSEASELAQAFNEMLERLEEERAESTRRALEAQESERLRVAQELHDEVGQSLTAALLQLARIKKSAPPELGDELAQAAETVRENLDELRRIAERLRPQELDELGLVSALAHFSERLGQQAELPIKRRVDPELPMLDYEQELVIYRVAQEALTNVVRHAQASRAELVLKWDDDRVLLRVTDDGQGVAAAEPGGGIRGMHERAALIGAQLRVEALEGGGSQVALGVPLDGGRR
jgi:two-component system, NarL family, sensor histidine kinase UhpB